MPTLTFIFPHMLWLLLLLPLLWAVALATPRRVSRARRGLSLFLRTMICVCLVLALAGTQLNSPVGATTTIFLIDGSDSVALSQRARAEAFVQRALTHMGPDDRAGMIIFGEQALIERPPSNERVFGQVAFQPRGAATNIEEAIQLGTALLPAEGHQRLVLLSDGGETSGDALLAARRAAAQGIPIDIVPLSGVADGVDAQVSAVELPAATRTGQQLRMRIELESNTATRGRLSVEGPGGATLVDQDVELPVGPLRLEVILPEPPPSFNRYLVRLRVEGDVRTENNANEAYTFVTGKPRILLVENTPGEAQNLQRALAAAQLDAVIMSPSAAPQQIGDLASYDATILVNVPRAAMRDSTISALSAYVHDLGRGLMMVGGPHSFGAGGWRDTPVETALPVTMDIPTMMRTPPVSVVVVIDISGSMGVEEGGRTKLSLALEGAQRIAALLRDDDQITVIPFDTEPHFVVGPLPGSERDRAIEALSQVAVGGGGINIHDALVEASTYIRASTHPIRHIITLTDGSDTTQKEGALALVQSLQAEGVTLSSIAIGDGPDVPFIRDIAATGLGRTFLTDQASNLPNIMVDETQAVLRPYILEQPFTPLLGAQHPALRELRSSPQLYGLVLTTARETSQVLLATPEGVVVLAAGQYGLGRSLAWTSDLSGRWGKDWITWEEYPRLSAQLVTWLLPTTSSDNLSMQSSSANGALVLSAQARNARGEPLAGLEVSARMYGGPDQSVDIALQEVGPGQYRATITDQPAGVYLVQLTANNRQGEPVAALTAGAVMPLSAEYRAQAANPALLEALARTTTGRMNPEPAASFEPNGLSRGATQEIGLPLLVLALILVPLDIAARRLFLGRGVLAEARREAMQPRAPAEKPEPKPAKPVRTDRASDLEQLRAAQEQARKRARGEE